MKSLKEIWWSLSEASYTSIDFWMSLSLPELLEWVEMANEHVDKQEKEMKVRKKK